MYDARTSGGGLGIGPSTSCDLQQSSHLPRVLLPQQYEALARLDYIAARRRGFALLAGPAGSGKTLLLRQFADQLRRNAATAVSVDARGCDEAELLRECCDELGLGCSDGATARSLRAALLEAVRGRCTTGAPIVLIVDHAGRGDDGAARIVERLLSTTSVLAGPTIVAACREPVPAELAAIAREHADVRIQLPALTVDETGSVIEGLSGGGRFAGFTPQAVQDAHALTDGDLHRVNRLWRLAQSAAELEETGSVDARMIEWVAPELPE